MWLLRLTLPGQGRGLWAATFGWAQPCAAWHRQDAYATLSLNSEIEQVVLLLVLENSLAVTLIERNSAGIFGPCLDAEAQQIEHDDEHDPPTSESGFKRAGAGNRWFTGKAARLFALLTGPRALYKIDTSGHSRLVSFLS